MYTEPEIVSSPNLKVRAYLYFYFEGKPVKEYTGNRTTLKIFPNRAKTVKERDRRLEALRLELLKCLSSQTYPVKRHTVVKKPILSTREVLGQALQSKLSKKLSKQYKDDLSLIHDQFTKHLEERELDGQLTDLSPVHVQDFLQRFNSSGTYYMRRSDISILLNATFRILRTPSITKEIETMKGKAVLHEPYTKLQIGKLLEFLAKNEVRLYICCLLTYSSWLRPHVEILNLKCQLAPLRVESGVSIPIVYYKSIL